MKKISPRSKKIETISAYERALPRELAAICKVLRAELEVALPTATAKIWHGAPVWFLGDFPIVAYSLKAKTSISLLFWNGQSFDDADLKPVGKFKAAEARFSSTDEINTTKLRRQLKKARTLLWDYEGIPLSRRPKSAAT